MSDKSLRNKIIRLAHAKPELRKHLLPIVANSEPQSLEEIEIGSVWVSTYSYSSTIHTFYEVVAKTPKSVKIQELEKVYVGGRFNSMTWDVAAKAGNYKQGTRPMLAKVRDGGRGVVLTSGGKYGVYASLWNGRPMQEMSD